MKIDASISIIRDNRDVIRIRVKDESARVQLLEVSMSPHDFAMAVTGLSEIKCSAQATHLDKAGKVRERQHRSAMCPLNTYDRTQLQDWLKENCQEEGWILDTYLGSQSSVCYKGNDGVILNYSVTRYLDKEV